MLTSHKLLAVVWAGLGISWSPIPSQPRCQNQCVFVRGYRISIRPRILRKLKGPLEVSPVEDADPEDVLCSSTKSSDIPFAGSGGKRALFGRSNENVDSGTGSRRRLECPGTAENGGGGLSSSDESDLLEPHIGGMEVVVLPLATYNCLTHIY
jgi:hypothetical protein